MITVGIVGTTSWGTTLGLLAAKAGHRTSLWARTEQRAEELNSQRENRRFLPGATFPDLLTVTASPEAAFAGADVVIIAVPSLTLRKNLDAVAGSVNDAAMVVSATKGIEIASGKRMTQLIAEMWPTVPPDQIGVLSGPNLAPEIARGRPASATVAFPHTGNAQFVQEVFNSDLFRVYTGRDVIGVELGGALKNIIAIGAGFVDGVGLGNNAKAALVTRGLHEITRLGVAMGAEPLTFAGLSGMGDLITTCYSPLSRNYRLGGGMATGSGLEEALRSLGSTAEGVPTTRAAIRLAQRYGVEMPITETTNAVFEGRMSASDAILALMRRAPQPEALI